MSDLKPCPFCGAAAEIIYIEDGENAGGSCVSCTACMASSNVEFEFKENFVDNWNSRAATAREAELRAALADAREVVIILADLSDYHPEEVALKTRATLARIDAAITSTEGPSDE